MKKVSVIIPTYKDRGGLRKAVLSALGQEGVIVEVFVVDDNSPESEERKRTELVMSEFVNEEKVIYIKHPCNKNGSAARNTGLKASTGEYIAFLDDDDFYMPRKLEKQVAFLEENTCFDAVYCFAGRNGKRLGETAFEGDVTKELLLLNTFMQTSCLLFRREAIMGIDGFDESFRRHQDYEMLLRFFHKGYKMGCLQEILTEMGANDGENTVSGEKLEETKKHFFEKFQPYIEELEFVDRGFSNRVYAKHYACVFLTHIKTHRFKMASKVFWKYFIKAPGVFYGVINSSIIQHLRGIR